MDASILLLSVVGLLLGGLLVGAWSMCITIIAFVVVVGVVLGFYEQHALFGVSVEGRMVDALAAGADEGRGNLR